MGQNMRELWASLPPQAGAVWQPPFGLGSADNTGDATARLVDLQQQLAQWKDVGYANEMATANGALDRQLKAFYGPGRPLTADEAKALTASGLLAFQANQGALKDLQTKIAAELDKYSGSNAQDALDNVKELLHQAFTKGEGADQIADLTAMVAKANKLVGKIHDFVGFAAKGKVDVQSAEKLEGLVKGFETFKSSLSDAKDALDLAGDIATLAGKVGQKPGDTANAINSLKAGLKIADFVMSKASVPVIGQWWSGYIKPCTEMALDKLQKLDDLIDKSTRGNLAEDWWQQANKGMAAPSITDSGLNGTLLAKVFPGGQPVLDFMWSLFRGSPPDGVPDAVQKHMLKFRKQFNAGQPESNQLQTDSEWTNAWKLFGDESSPNLKSWVMNNKEMVWAMEYGALPHP